MAQTGRKKKKPTAAPAADAAGPKPSSARQARRERAVAGKLERQREWILLGGVLLVTAFAFFNSLDGQFVYDDRLQVVRNPSWLTPYVACVMVAAGLVIQFLSHLVGFAKKRTA